jgi:hypothetical protein
MSKMTGETPWTINVHFKKMRDRRIKWVFSGEKYQWKGGRHKVRVNEGEYSGCILYSSMNRRMKPVEIFLCGREGKRRNDEVVNQLRYL